MSEFINRLVAYGADMTATLERFVGDEALYERCFGMFMEDASFAELERALREKDYTAAFNAAHTLKGVAGNLGLTPLYEKICQIVESLRHQDYSHLDAEYQAILAERTVVESLR